MALNDWSHRVMNLLKRLNKFTYKGLFPKHEYVEFFVESHKVGILSPPVVELLLTKYSGHFKKISKGITFNVGTDSTYDTRTKIMEQILLDMRKDKDHVCLNGWRNECYEVSPSPSHPSLLRMERSAVNMFGIRSYGSHMNGFVEHPVRGTCVWIARRSLQKQTYPGMLDNMVAGGISSGISIVETIIKECNEEAGIPESIARNVTPVGCISYIYEDERGVEPALQYCFDLQLPIDFVPKPCDGEVQEFKLCEIDEVKELIVGDEFKPNSAVVTLDFLLRRGFVDPDQVPNYTDIALMLRSRF